MHASSIPPDPHSAHRVRAGLLASLLLAVAPAEAALNFTRIAHSDDAVFADLKLNQPAFAEFGFGPAAINSLGEVAFLAGAVDNSSGDAALFRGNGGVAPSALLRSDGNQDDAANPLGFISSGAVPLALDGDVVFGATLKDGGAGIFRYDAASGATSAIATDQRVTAASGFATGAFDMLGLRPSMNGNGDVVFSAVIAGGATAGLFRGADPLADRVTDSTLGADQAFFWNDPVITAGGLVGAVTNNFDPASSAFWNEAVVYAPGAGSALASTQGGSPATIQQPTLDLNHSLQAVFIGANSAPGVGLPDSQILLATPFGPPTSVADAKFSGGAFPFRAFTSEVALGENGAVAFVARDAHNEEQLLVHQIGRRTTSQGNVYAEVLRSGATLDGRVVDRIQFTREGQNERGEFAFVAHFDDGTSGVYKANFGSTAPGVVPRPGLRAEAESRRYDMRTHVQTVVEDVDVAPVPGNASAAVPMEAGIRATASALNDATGSHLKAVAEASSLLDFSSVGGSYEGETRALSSIITNWIMPNPGNGQTGETVTMLVTIDGSLSYERQPSLTPIFTSSGQGRLASPGGGRIQLTGPVSGPNVPLLAEVNYIVNANVGGTTFNAFGGYARLTGATLTVAGDWDPTAWNLAATSDSLQADIDTFALVTYDITYDEVFALEFVVETFASAHFFGTGTALADFGNTARFSLRSASGVPVLQLGSDGAAVVPLPPSLALLLPACGLLLARRRRGSRPKARDPSRGARQPRAPHICQTSIGPCSGEVRLR
ncbi:MAG: hypothetical protein AB7P42_11820 [Gammaproteobacteria bacterium]